MIAPLAAVVALVMAGLMLARLASGPTMLDRLAASHGLWLACALALAAFGVALKSGAPLILAFVFVVVDAVLLLGGVKAMRLGTFQPPLAPLERDEP